ncbi:MAG: hypothetical protein V1743_03800 [Nanoarchaeota archaeon]
MSVSETPSRIENLVNITGYNRERQVTIPGLLTKEIRQDWYTFDRGGFHEGLFLHKEQYAHAKAQTHKKGISLNQMRLAALYCPALYAAEAYLYKSGLVIFQERQPVEMIGYCQVPSHRVTLLLNNVDNAYASVEILVGLAEELRLPTDELKELLKDTERFLCRSR